MEDKNIDVKSVDNYIENQGEKAQKSVLSFVSFMKEILPGKRAGIVFSMPMWKRGKKMNEGYVAISAAKQHYSIHFSDEDFVKNLSSKFRCGKRCANIPYDDKDKENLIREYVKEFVKDWE